MCLCVHSKLQIGLASHQKVKSQPDEGDVDGWQVAGYLLLRSQVFFERAEEYSIQNLPLDDSILQNMLPELILSRE